MPHRLADEVDQLVQRHFEIYKDNLSLLMKMRSLDAGQVSQVIRLVVQSQVSESRVLSIEGLHLLSDDPSG